MTTRPLAAALLCLAVAVGCSAGPSATPAGGRVNVVATTTVFADLVRGVGGERVDVVALVPPGGEVHTFDPAPSDAARVASADLLVLNGLGLDDWVVDFARQSGGGDDTRTLELAEGLSEFEYIESAGSEEDDDHAEHSLDPHLWLDVQAAQLYADRIRLKLIEIDPAGQSVYDANADAQDEQLAALDIEIAAAFGALGAEQRRVVSFHDAFGYFARAYDLGVVGVVLDAPGQEPSAAEIAALVERIRASGARAILAEAQFSDDLARTIADEADVRVVSELYTDSLGDPPVDTYAGAMRWNTERIVEALQ